VQQYRTHELGAQKPLLGQTNRWSTQHHPSWFPCFGTYVNEKSCNSDTFCPWIKWPHMFHYWTWGFSE